MHRTHTIVQPSTATTTTTMKTLGITAEKESESRIPPKKKKLKETRQLRNYNATQRAAFCLTVNGELKET